MTTEKREGVLEGLSLVGRDERAGQTRGGGQAVNRLRDTEPEAWKWPDCTVGPGMHSKQHIRAPSSGGCVLGWGPLGQSAGLRAEGVCPGGRPAVGRGSRAQARVVGRRRGRS